MKISFCRMNALRTKETRADLSPFAARVLAAAISASSRCGRIIPFNALGSLSPSQRVDEGTRPSLRPRTRLGSLRSIRSVASRVALEYNCP